MLDDYFATTLRLALVLAAVAGCSEGHGGLEATPDGGRTSDDGGPSPGEGGAGGQPAEDPRDLLSEVLEPVADPVPVEGRHRGFNLNGMYKAQWGFDDGYLEEDFELIRELGFNFVRLPLDYLTYTDRDDWLEFTGEGLDKIDRAIEFGQRHGVHVSLNLHQAPGYCVHGWETSTVPEDQELDLWADAEAQEAFVAHWSMFAHRYHRIPAEHSSFNLVNEPSNVWMSTYLEVMQGAVDAIRADVDYEQLGDHELDRQMLDLLQAH